MHPDRTLLRPVDKMQESTGTVQYRRVLDPSKVFYTAWSHVDHIVIPPGASSRAGCCSPNGEFAFLRA